MLVGLMGVSALAGRTVLLTGVTGFLGTAILEKLLRSVPDCRVLALIRAGRSAGRSSSASDAAARRLQDEVLSTRAFIQLRERWGDGFDTEVARRVIALPGDLGVDRLGLSDDDAALLGEVDAVVHSAAEVAFDSPLDSALRTNLRGPIRLIETVLAAGARPAVVHVSTAYVSGVRRGLVAEGSPGGLASAGGAQLDWRAELAAAEAVRARVEGESRSPARIRRFAAQSRRGTGASGVPAGGAETERLRARWVTEQLIAHGRECARALGWSDVYTLTKALAELAVAEMCNGEGLPLSIVRPSIIESSIAEPSPGWIVGLRMAEPIILAYGRGLLPEFPGLPDGIIDLIPVDFVCNAAITAACAPPAAGCAVYHVGTGARNPLRFRSLFEHTRDYFLAHPLHDAGGAPIAVPDWSFPSGHREGRRLLVLERALETAIGAVERGPASRRTRALAQQFDAARDRVRRARSLAGMYAVYTEMDAVFDDSATRALDLGRSAEERAEFPFDVGAIDWTAYLEGSHIPAIVELARLRRREPRPVLPQPTLAPSADPARLRLPAVRATDRALAVFDVEGTIADLTVVQHYLYFLLDTEPRRRWPLTIARTALSIPGWIRLDRANRLDFQRRFYRQYAGFEPDAIAAAARRAFHEVTLPRCFPRALRRVREHVDAGHRVVLITGALEEVVRPLAELLEVELRAARLRVVDGIFDGDLAETPPSAEARGMLVRRLAEEADLRLAGSYAYADSISDLSMLEAVGHPVPVNPDLRLDSVARRRGWPVQTWTIRHAAGLPVVLPGPARTRHVAGVAAGGRR
jgi:alcohol-forming fatty acyl-CoA reductase